MRRGRPSGRRCKPMGFINVAERTINAKLVYFGVGVGGKTTSLQQVHGIFCPRNEVKLVSINTEEDSTLLFDFLPINLGNVGGFKIRIQGFTVPGQPKYRQMRKYVLQGADAVVLVVDSQRSRLQENLESLQSLREHLRSARGAGETIPIVVQYNKRDLADVLTEEELDRHFRFRSDLPTFPSVATEGHGVFEAFVQAAALLVESKIIHYGLARDHDEPRLVAEGVREKLWRLCDDARRTRTVVPLAELPRTQVAVAEAEPTLGYSLSEQVERPTPAPPPQAGDEPELRYELRDSAGSRREPEVFTPADLDLDLGSELLDFHPVVAPEPLPEHGLLDQTVQANLELAQRFGEVDEQRTLLERKVQELVDVAQQTVHDLNRPLSALRLMLSTLAKGYLGNLSEPVGKAVQNGLLAVQQMDRLVRDLLDSSRLDYDGLRLQFAACELGDIVHEVLTTLQYELAERDVQVVVEPLPCTPVDAWAMTKVFLNLLGNAILYGPVDRSPLIRIAAEDAGAEWLIRIGDNGIGIPEQDLPRLFRRFERGSNTAGISGTGLGLHIVKEIVQGHGGWVGLQSTVGVGTTFTLHLPKQPLQPAHSPVTETAARADL